MRILIVTDAWRPQVNGVARTYEELSTRLTSWAEVHILTPEQFKSLPLPTYPEIRLAVPPIKKVQKLIRDLGPDIVHIATEGPLGLLARSTCLHFQIPFTTSYHTRYPEYLRGRFPVPLSWTYEVLKRFHNASIHTLVSTKALSVELRERGFQRPLVWRRGVNVEMFSKAEFVNIRLQRPIFLYVGRLAIEKNIDDFLKLNLPGTKIVVGDGPERMRLQNTYPNAKFFGFMYGDDLAAVYRAADCFVFPSKTDTYGLVMAESLAAGTPVACYPTSGFDEIAQGEKCGVASENLREAALSALAISRDLCSEVGRRHSFDESARHFLQILENAYASYAATTSGEIDLSCDSI
jgi:glycosyltransferase involved in cell wall biosynthesis